MRIVHVIVGLGDGGAEKSLYKIVSSDKNNFHGVISLTSEGKYGPFLSHRGVHVVSIHWNFFRPLRSFFKLLRGVRAMKPDVLHGWMPHAALAVSVMKNLTGTRRIIWSIRSSEYGTGLENQWTRLIVRTLAWLSHTVPSRIIVVGHRALQNHADAGFKFDKMVCVPNGYTSSGSNPWKLVDNPARALSSTPNERIVEFGTVARYHPKKGHKILLQAFAALKAERSDWKLSLVGQGMSERNSDLVAEIERHGLSDDVLLLGQLDDPEPFFSQIDVHILASTYGEGFPNVVAESMLAGVPNIVTDVGDSAEIVGDTGWVVPAGDVRALSSVIEEVIASGSRELRKRGIDGAKRISKEFSLEKMVQSHIREYTRLNIACFPRYSRLGASSRIRAFQYEHFLVNAGWGVNFYPFSTSHFLRMRYAGTTDWADIFLSYLRRLFDLYRARNADLVWIQKELIPWGPAWLENMLLPRHSPVIYDFDDAVHERFTHSRNPFLRAALGKKIGRVVRKADGVVAGNQTLLDFFADQADVPGIVIPSVIDTKKNKREAQSSLGETSPFVFGWVGTPHTFRRYVEALVSDFETVAERLGAEFWIIGAGAPVLSSDRVKYFSWSEGTEISLLDSIDVGVMPLIDDAWSRGKCGFKILQYMALGKPVIASPVGVNVEIVEHGKNGYLAREPKDWGRYLEILAEDTSLALEMGSRAVQTVQTSYSLDVNAPKLIEFFRCVTDARGLMSSG